jgi:hypothetical protein
MKYILLHIAREWERHREKKRERESGVKDAQEVARGVNVGFCKFYWESLRPFPSQ